MTRVKTTDFGQGLGVDIIRASTKKINKRTSFFFFSASNFSCP